MPYTRSDILGIIEEAYPELALHYDRHTDTLIAEPVATDPMGQVLAIELFNKLAPESNASNLNIAFEAIEELSIKLENSLNALDHRECLDSDECLDILEEGNYDVES